MHDCLHVRGSSDKCITQQWQHHENEYMRNDTTSLDVYVSNAVMYSDLSVNFERVFVHVYKCIIYIWCYCIALGHMPS